MVRKGMWIVKNLRIYVIVVEKEQCHLYKSKSINGATKAYIDSLTTPNAYETPERASRPHSSPIVLERAFQAHHSYAGVPGRPVSRPIQPAIADHRLSTIQHIPYSTFQTRRNRRILLSTICKRVLSD